MVLVREVYIYIYIISVRERRVVGLRWCYRFKNKERGKRKNKEGRTRDIHSSATKKTREKNLGGTRVLLRGKGLMSHPYSF